MWPYENPVYVASNSMKSLPSGFEGRATLVTGSLSSMIEQLRMNGLQKVYIDGAQLIQSALRKSLLNELIVTTIPVLLGTGIPLFGHLSSQVKLRLISSKVLVGQIVKSHYQVVTKVRNKV